LVEGGRLFEVRTQADAPWNAAVPDYRIALGSCAYVDEAPFDRPGNSFGAEHGIFDVMAARAPDLTLWLGDNLYMREADYASRAGMAARWRQDFSHPSKRALLRTGQHAATWDDHDYGPNDSNASFVLKDESLRLFSSYWPNPSYGVPGMPGVFTQFGYADADVFMLDGRWYRDSHLGPAVVEGRPRREFGEAQMAWLRNALLASNKPLKIISAGGQFLADGFPWEGWHHYPAERDAFLAWLQQAGISGVVFVSGDRHHTELIRVERPGTYPLYELTCSPLTAGAFDSTTEKVMPRVVPGTWVAKRNFCEIRVEGARNARTVSFASFDSAGTQLWSEAVELQKLSAPR
jgi:alkaline phosphatase D